MNLLYQLVLSISGKISVLQFNQFKTTSAGGGTGGAYSLIDMIPHGFVHDEYISIAEKSDIFIS